jgi:hypothetical protein
MLFPKQCCAIVAVAVACASNLSAAPIYLTFNFDSDAIDVLGNPATNTNGTYNLKDDYDNVPINTPFLAFDAAFQPLITMDVTGSGLSTLETFGGTGLGVGNATIDAGETIDITFNEPVYIRGLATDMLTIADTMVYSANGGINGGFESAIFGDDGVVTTYFILNANDPLRIASVNGSFSLQSITIQLPEPSTRGTLAGLLMLTLWRRGRASVNADRMQWLKLHWYRATSCYLRLGL